MQYSNKLTRMKIDIKVITSITFTSNVLLIKLMLPRHMLYLANKPNLMKIRNVKQNLLEA